ncbi:SNF2 helicase associated domain-containing protein [Brevibacillus sp. SYSU BS000544]|uniref:SNF2 helicase associated domain-containing protein n=1 Tax=Brevibacillus sp. SYSU BS000544 TaxID=3416443 RepID=UPI003CE5760D
MSFQLTHKVIKMLCGEASYKKGEAYFRSRKVTFTLCDPETSHFEATVKGISIHQVTIDLDENGDVGAECTCPSLGSYNYFCQHIAAVLFSIKEIQNEDGLSFRPTSPKPSYPTNDAELTSRLLSLFHVSPQPPSGTRRYFDTRSPLEVEIICKLITLGYKKQLFGIELKVGPKRIYVVQKIREFLDHVERKKTYVFSKHFTYDPELHSFHQENDQVIRQLIHICQNERMYLETSNSYSTSVSRSNEDRALLVPPSTWPALLPLLTNAPSVQLVIGDKSYHGIHLADEPIPLQFQFDQADKKGYQLEVHGLDELAILEPYSIAHYEGKIFSLPVDQCKRLTELKQILESSKKHQIQITQEQMEPFMEKVVPGLMKLGRVQIAQAVSNRILQTQLKANLYLDRIRDRLLAGLEFQYGDIIINPLDESNVKRSTDRILMRDGDQERKIMELMEQSSFTKTEGGYYLSDEEAEYDFLYHIVPQLEKMVKVYATSAVKERLHTGHTPPKVSVSLNDRMNWLELQFQMDGIRESDIRKILKSLEEKRRYYRLPNGALLPLESSEFQDIHNFMDEIGIDSDNVEGREIRIPVARGLRLIHTEQTRNSIKLGKSFRQLLENMRNPDHLDFPVPEKLEPILRDYQKYGYQWLKTLAHYHFGGILADDMGLGKTLQSIAFIVSVLSEIREQKQPAIIVSPASLLYNWRNEINKFAPEIRSMIIDGTRTERNTLLNAAAEVDVIITSYPLLRRDIQMYQEHFFHTLILDEAQVFKNHHTQTAQVVKEIQATYRFALTGTPVENRLEELWSIYDAVFPDLFPNRRQFNELPREIVAKRSRPFLLRRLKTDVLTELPEKIESIQASELLPEQKKLYAAYLAKLREETLKHLDKETFDKNKIKILAGLTRLRQLCCHPSLFVEEYRGSSAKFEQLLEIVDDCRSAGKRMLIFSQFTEMLGMIGKELGYLGIPFFYLDGQTPASERVELCNRFNDGERDLFLVSLKAGGTGLNLTGADTVILYDLWWNPAVEQQAADRAHRIGQKNVVQVIRLVTQGTVEEKMIELQQRKKNLIEEVIQPGQEALSTLTEQDIREILMI